MKLFVYQGRLRSGWRLIIHTIFVLFFTFLIGIPITLIFVDLDRLPSEPSAEAYASFDNRWLFVSQLSFAIGLTLATYLARRWLDKKPFRSLGVEINCYTILDLLAGIIIAGLMMGVIFLLELVFGWLKIEGFAWQVGDISHLWIEVFLVAILFILVGWTEELLSRGYHLQNLVEGLNLPAGMIISSLIFAMLHQANPSFTLSAFLGLFSAGLFFCFAYIWIGNLWLPIGLHIGWNFFEGVVFGFQVSGLTNLPKLIYHSVSGPEWMTGGEFGPEAGMILLSGLFCGFGLIIAYRKWIRVMQHKLA
ncbi:MAG: CPBP family intramembrane metalloprotease [Anaerolineales bacterium]|nr:CPBP family intramembrane metalloprotease [Anaerolineales bacterium]